MTEAAANSPRDLYVVSDLHLGRGLDPASRRHRRLEAFLYDEDFRDFCRHVCAEAASRGRGATLVLNGDVFDLLRIEPGAPRRGADTVERRFGPLPGPHVAAAMVADILAGHDVFVDALADLLAAGQRIVFLPGNHDLEIQWPEVQDVVRGALAARLRERDVDERAVEGLDFRPWFFHEPGRIWVEHGCQYDPENAFRFPLRRRLARMPFARALLTRDLPFGNFFQKYLYNAFGSITFIVPSSRANYRYFRFLLANEPALLLRVARSHGRFLVQLIRRLARAPVPSWAAKAEAAQQEEIAELAAESGIGERLQQIADLKYVGADAARAAAGMLRQALKGAATIFVATMLVIGALSAASRTIDALQFGIGLKSLLSLVLYLAVGTAAAAALVSAALRVPRDEPPRPLGSAASRIAGILDVPIVAFGHTHDEVVHRLERPAGEPAWYFNTGTWIAVFTHDVLIPRERVQFTFLRVRDAEPELLHWSTPRQRPVPVILLEEGGLFPGAEEGGAARARTPPPVWPSPGGTA